MMGMMNFNLLVGDGWKLGDICCIAGVTCRSAAGA